MIVKVKKLNHFDDSFGPPLYRSWGAAGADICAAIGKGKFISLQPKQKILVPTGLIFEIPPGFELQVRSRSGIVLKSGLMILNSPGTIDSDYRGELKIIIGNFGEKEEVINHGDRIAQIILAPIIQAEFVFADEVTQTERGSNGFGSTGV